MRLVVVTSLVLLRLVVVESTVVLRLVVVESGPVATGRSEVVSLAATGRS